MATPGTAPVISAAKLAQRAELFANLFAGTFVAWQTCGCVRRGKAGNQIVHVVFPMFQFQEAAAPAGSVNAVWARARELSLAGKISPWRQIEPSDRGVWISEDHALVECREGTEPFCQSIVLADHANWGMMLARYTGPDSYWRFLLSRLQLAGVLKLHHNHVCWMDRETATPTPRQLDCNSEQEFFALARSRWKEPRYRWEVLGDEHWRKGMLPESYPSTVRPYACPVAQPHLFPNDKPAYSALDPRARAIVDGKRRRRK